jgi:hypothetical protein
MNVVPTVQGSRLENKQLGDADLLHHLAYRRVMA